MRVPFSPISSPTFVLVLMMAAMITEGNDGISFMARGMEHFFIGFL
jgi:hypothetical protein